MYTLILELPSHFPPCGIKCERLVHGGGKKWGGGDLRLRKKKHRYFEVSRKEEGRSLFLRCGPVHAPHCTHKF